MHFLRNLSLFFSSLLNKYKSLNEQDLEIFIKQIYILFKSFEKYNPSN